MVCYLKRRVVRVACSGDGLAHVWLAHPKVSSYGYLGLTTTVAGDDLECTSFVLSQGWRVSRSNDTGLQQDCSQRLLTLA
jgi:hypothetical protein